MSWKELVVGSPELATFGKERFGSGVAYLATVKKDGGPRVHPVTPIVGDEQLFLFMESTSPKGHDLRRDGRYALHSSVGDSSGEGGEFLLSGTARFVKDDDTRAIAVSFASYDPADRYILFELQIETALATVYNTHGTPIRSRWKRSSG
jgi:hypothetical protein